MLLGEGVYVIWNGRKYLKEEDDFKTYLTDVSDNKVKINLEFGRNVKKSDKAIEGVKNTLQEVLF